LNSRVLDRTGQGGVLAERLDLDLDDAFTQLRNSARSHNRRLSDLAQAIVNGTEQLRPVPPC
jgi:AmiR/NasT family two-component response regulator